jgi:hypothetical protein
MPATLSYDQRMILQAREAARSVKWEPVQISDDRETLRLPVHQSLVFVPTTVDRGDR